MTKKTREGMEMVYRGKCKNQNVKLRKHAARAEMEVRSKKGSPVAGQVGSARGQGSKKWGVNGYM